MRGGRRRTGWILISGCAAASVVAVAVVALAIVPVSHSATESFVLKNGGSLTPLTHPVRFPDSGEFAFHWSTVGGGTVTFTVLNPGGITLYQASSAASGTGNIAVTAGSVETFEILDWLPETVDVSGTLSYSAPTI
jgi:hypothetical protein